MNKTEDFIIHHKSVLSKTVRVKNDAAGLSIGVEGLGLYEMEPNQIDCGPIYLDLYEGKPRLIVWADINSSDATHVIDLSPAMEVNRR